MSSIPLKRNPLHVTEIFHVVLDCISEPRPCYASNSYLVQIRTPQIEGQRALAALAQTCRMFSKPCLDCLWLKLDSLRPLLRCFLAREILARHGKESLRPPSLAEWSIINRYSCRIQELEISDQLSLFLLECSAFENLLPNLRVLRWNMLWDHSLASIQPLLGPNLVSFHLRLDSDTGDHKELMSLLKILPSRYPSLKVLSLDIDLDRDKERITPVLSRVVCSFEKVDRLAVHKNTPIDGVALRRLVTSPQFTQLFLATQPLQLEQLSLRSSDTPFPGAKEISLSRLDLASVTGLLRSEGQPFSVAKFHLDATPTSQVTLAFLTVFASRPRRASLQSITLHSSAEQLEELRENDYVLSRDTLQPLAFFHNLRELSIDVTNPVSLDDMELADLARGWPLLRFLRLVSRNALSTKHLTFRGLLSIVVACPRLERVDLNLDAREVPTSGEGADVRSDTVRELSFPGSPIDDPRLVATFLWEHFPCVSGARAASQLRLGHMYYAQKWLDVQRYVKRLKKGQIKP